MKASVLAALLLFAVTACASKPESLEDSRVIRLQHTAASDIETSLRELIVNGGSRVSGLRVAAAPRENAILLLGPKPAVEQATTLIARLDIKPK